MTTPKNPLDKVLSKYSGLVQEEKTQDLASLDLFDFMAAASPELLTPWHLESVLPYLNATERKPQCFSFSAPPRHGKSTLVCHYVAWMMIRHPGILIAYGCYGEELSTTFSDIVKGILRSIGMEIDRSRNTRKEWRLTNGSLFKAVSPGSAFTGRGADIIIIDDPYKSRVTASSGAVRMNTWNWFTGVAITRRSPNASVIVTHTRWNNEDLIGQLTDEKKWPFINMPAITPDGDALWSSQWPMDRLKEIRETIGEYDWASLYMGQPRPLGGAVFNGATSYTDADFEALLEDKQLVRYVIGIDCAYTKKAHADYSVAVVLAVAKSGRAYIVDVRRKQVEAQEFAEVLKELRRTYENPPIYWYVGGQEKVIAEFFRNSCGIPIKDVPTGGEDKFARAQSCAAAWNAGKILIPDDVFSRPWVSKFLSEVESFTGLDDPHDDQVDALASAFIPLSRPKNGRGMAKNWVVPF